MGTLIFLPAGATDLSRAILETDLADLDSRAIPPGNYIPFAALPDMTVTDAAAPAPFFTTTASAPKYTDPSPVPDNTTVIEYVARLRIPTGAALGTNRPLFSQASLGYDVRLIDGQMYFQVQYLKDSTSTTLLSGSDVGGAPRDEWIDMSIAAD